MDGKIWPTQTPKWRTLGGSLPTSTTNVTGFVRDWGKAVPKILSFVVKTFMCCTGSFSVETGEGRAKKSKNVSASEIYYMAEKQCFRLSYNQKLRERERQTREKEKLEQKERESKRVQRLAVLVIWLKWSNKIPTSYFSRFPGWTCEFGESSCIFGLVMLPFIKSSSLLIFARYKLSSPCLFSKRWKIDRLAWPY